MIRKQISEWLEFVRIKFLSETFAKVRIEPWLYNSIKRRWYWVNSDLPGTSSSCLVSEAITLFFLANWSLNRLTFSLWFSYSATRLCSSSGSPFSTSKTEFLKRFKSILHWSRNLFSWSLRPSCTVRSSSSFRRVLSKFNIFKICHQIFC